MAEYDGSIKIKTEINAKSAQVQLQSLENRIVKAADKVASLRSKMDSLKNSKIPTQEYQEISAQIEKAETKFDKLLEKQEQMQREGKDNGVAWERLNYQMNEIGNEIRYAKGELKDLVNTGKAFTLGRDTEEFANLSQKLQYAESDLTLLNQKHDVLISNQHKAAENYKKLGNTAKNSLEKVNKAQKKSNGFLGTMASRFKGLALSLLIFNQVSKAFNSLTNGIKEGFSNLYKGNKGFKSSVDSLKASVLTLKNSFAAAFRPLVEIAIPYIQKAIKAITQLINKMGQFFALITGQKTYTKAVEQTADAFKEAGKEADGYLSPLDEINKYQSKDDSGATGSSAGAMFEEVPIDNKLPAFLEKIAAYGKELKSIFSQGFMDGLGDWEYRWEDIKESIASIKENLKEIFLDPEVTGAADSYAKSTAYMLGSVAGSATSIGLSIGTNLLGGIEKYLSQNKGRIKEYFVSMFSIGDEINNIIAELSQSIALIFEAFASEEAQQLTANTLGILLNTFMNLSEIAAKFSRDILKVFAQPIIDNAEKFKTALEGILGFLSQITGTIKEGLDETFAKFNEVYDEHLKPFFDSVSQGLSNLTSKFLDFWNGKVKPVLDKWAEKFDVLWKEHIQPALSSAMELFGSLGDLLKAFWENRIYPMISWIIDYVFPVLLPLLDTLYNAAVKVLGGIWDFLKLIIDGAKKAIDLLTAFTKGDSSSIFEASANIVFGKKESSTSARAASVSAAPAARMLSGIEFPGYATGQVIPTSMKKHLAWLGDNNRETEVVSPLSTIEQAVENVLARRGSNGNQTVVVKLIADGKELTDLVIRNGEVRQMSSGSNPFLLGNR